MVKRLNPQRGSALIAVLCVLGIFIALAAAVLGIIFSANNTAVAHEKGLLAAYDNNQILLSTYYQKVGETAQVPDMMTDAQRKVIRDAMEGRYGQDGSRAVFQSIQESNPTVSETMYIKIQTLIEAGRDEYKVGQQSMVDKRRVYEKELDSIPGGFVMKFMGFPRVDMSKFKPVTTDAVDTVYKNGKESGPLQIRPTAPPAAPATAPVGQPVPAARAQ